MNADMSIVLVLFSVHPKYEILSPSLDLSTINNPYLYNPTLTGRHHLGTYRVASPLIMFRIINFVSVKLNTHNILNKSHDNFKMISANYKAGIIVFCCFLTSVKTSFMY